MSATSGHEILLAVSLAGAGPLIVGLSAALVAVLTWSVCALLTPSPSLPLLATCVVVAAALAFRPIWSWRPPWSRS